MSTLHVYRIDDGEQHWYIASSARRALTLFAKDQLAQSAKDYLKDCPETTVFQLDDNAILPTNQEDKNGSYKPVRHRCSTWAKQGAGFLCTANF